MTVAKRCAHCYVLLPVSQFFLDVLAIATATVAIKYSHSSIITTNSALLLQPLLLFKEYSC
jgi:hypothetical protein